MLSPIQQIPDTIDACQGEQLMNNYSVEILTAEWSRLCLPETLATRPSSLAAGNVCGIKETLAASVGASLDLGTITVRAVADV